jgi:hypothetical protein
VLSARVWEVDLNLSQHCPHASAAYLSAVVLAVLGEAACRRFEIVPTERLIELFGDAPIVLGNVQGSPPVAAWDSADCVVTFSFSSSWSGTITGLSFSGLMTAILTFAPILNDSLM